MNKNGDIIIYQSEDGITKIDVHMENETVWLTQLQMAELFNTTKQNISLHINNCFKEGELLEDAVVKDYLTTASDGKNYNTKYYTLDVIISVGYRVKSPRGTQFRIWANERLKEYLIKGFTMNDDLLKKAGGGNYWDELLSRIRDIRSSEKVFYRKILDIYSTSIDYNPDDEQTKLFFATVQNKMHYAAHGNTASEIIMKRANANLPHMGLTNFKKGHITKSDVSTAKSYLSDDELNILNRLVSAYLEFAELQALRKNKMYMKDWIVKLDDFIKMSGSEILQGGGTVSALQAKNKALAELNKFKMNTPELSKVELDFIDNLKVIESKVSNKNKELKD